MKTLLIILFVITTTIYSQTYLYVNKYATGSGDGSDWENAYVDVPLTTLQRGYTYFVCDGNYLDSGGAINVLESGTQWITIKKATLQTHGTNTGWVDSLGDGQAVFTGNIGVKCGYIMIDGSISGDTGGFFPDTSKYGFKIKQKEINDEWHYLIKAPHSDDMDNFTVKNVFFSNKGWDANYGQVGVYIGGDFNNENYLIENCAFYRQSTSIIGYTADYLKVTKCFFYESWSNEGCCHGQTVSFGEETDSLEFSYCKVYDPTTFIFGTHAIQDQGQFGWKIHHNIFVGDGSNMTGGIANANSSTDTNSMVGAHIYNNTFYNFGFGRGAVYIGLYSLQEKNFVENNLFYKIDDAGMSDSVTIDKDYNFFINCTGDFKVDTHDSVMTSNAIFFDTTLYDFRLRQPLLNGNELSGYEVDFLGNIRGVNTDWSVGAYGYTDETPPNNNKNSCRGWVTR